MNSPYYRKTGLPGLAGTHDKPSPVQWAFLAKIPAAIAKVAKVAAKAGKVVAKGAKVVGKTVAKGAQAVGKAGKFVGEKAGKVGQKIGEGAKKAGQKIGEGAKKFAGKDGFVDRALDKVDDIKGKVGEFAEKNPRAYKAIMGGVGQIRSGTSGAKAELDQSIYAANEKEKENRSKFQGMSFGGGPLTRKYKKY